MVGARNTYVLHLCFALLLVFLFSLKTFAQKSINDLAVFDNPGPNWTVVQDVRSGLKQKQIEKGAEGSGVIINKPGEKAGDLITKEHYGDMDLELDFMLAAGASSGIYFQGRYEVQLMDSWRVLNPNHNDNGGIYERWNESRGEGQKDFEGHAPRQNVSRAPGLWQHLKVSFQAPRFDVRSRQKTENARILSVQLNGVVIQEDVELTGPTRASISMDEAATGPLRFQGDHGSVAFRNIKVTPFDKPRPQLIDLKYSVFKGRYQDEEPDYTRLPPEAQGTSVILTSSVSKIPNEYLIRYSGRIRVLEPGTYSFDFNASGGRGLLKINNQRLISLIEGGGKKKVNLPAGDLPFELIYSKFISYYHSGFGLTMEGPGIRHYTVSDININSNVPVDPILVPAPVNTILRSFIDLPDGIRVMHGINVGSPIQVHYMFDMEHAMVVQAWRGGFLDATPMWNGRGDGSSKPIGSVLYLGTPKFMIGKLHAPQDLLGADSLVADYRSKGYVLDKSKAPTFKYQVYGVTIDDTPGVLEGGEGIKREIALQTPVPDLYIRLAEGKAIEMLSGNLYAIDDKSYYLRLDDTGGAQAIVRESNGRQELIIPISSKVSYSIIF